MNSLNIQLRQKEKFKHQWKDVIKQQKRNTNGQQMWKSVQSYQFFFFFNVLGTVLRA